MDWASKKEENRRLKKLYEKTRFNCFSGAYYDDKKHRLIRFSPPPEKKKFAKKQSAKCVRFSTDELISGKGFRAKRMYDYKWNVN